MSLTWEEAEEKLEKIIPEGDERWIVKNKLLGIESTDQRLEYFNDTDESARVNLLALAGLAPKEYDITIIASTGKQCSWAGWGKPKLEALLELVHKEFPDSLFSDYTLTWRIPNDVVQRFEATASQWNVRQATLFSTIKLQLLTKAFSDFSLTDGLVYLGLPPHYEVRSGGPAEFAAADLPEDATADGLQRTHHALFHHFAEDLCMRRTVLGSPEMRLSELTRRDLISPALVLAVLLVPGMRLVSEEAVHGRLGNGPLDYLVMWKSFIIRERKDMGLEQEEGPAFAQTAAAPDDFVRRLVTGTKRKQPELDTDLPVPSTTMLSSGLAYRFYRYYPATGSMPRRLLKSRVFPMDLEAETTPEAILPQLKSLVSVVVACLEFQRTVVVDSLATKRLKLISG